MKANFILIIEIIIAIAFLFFLDSLIPKFYLNIKNFIEEDVYAFLISLNYLNFSSIDDIKKILCTNLAEIVPEYIVYINDSLVCGNQNIRYNKIIKTFYIVNGEIINIYIGLE